MSICIRNVTPKLCYDGFSSIPSFTMNDNDRQKKALDAFVSATGIDGKVSVLHTLLLQTDPRHQRGNIKQASELIQCLLETLHAVARFVMELWQEVFKSHAMEKPAENEEQMREGN